VITRLSALFAIILVAAFPAMAGPVDQARLDVHLNQLVAQDNMVGLAVAVIEDGEITFMRGYGETHVGGLPVTPDTVFRWASLSKGVASTATIKLAAQGRLSITDLASEYSASLRLPKGGEQRATIENILSHMVGVVPNAYDTTLEDGGDPATIRVSLGKLKATCPVGDCHTYQNVAFDVISEVIETVSGQSYANYVQSNLFSPLGMRGAGFGKSHLESAPSWARPNTYKRRSQTLTQPVVNHSYYNVPAAGGVNGSILDLALFARAQMGLMPNILSETDLTDLHTPRVYTRREQSGMSRRYGGQVRDARYALGWRTYKFGEAGHKVVGHRGAVEGYRSLILFDPERDSGVVALWNSNARQPVGLQFEVMDMIYDLPAQDWLQLDTPETPQ
jgi:beta-lactamase class C